MMILLATINNLYVYGLGLGLAVQVQQQLAPKGVWPIDGTAILLGAVIGLVLARSRHRKPPTLLRLLIMIVALLVVLGLTYVPWPTDSALALVRMPILQIIALLITVWGVAGSASVSRRY